MNETIRTPRLVDDTNRSVVEVSPSATACSRKAIQEATWACLQASVEVSWKQRWGTRQDDENDGVGTDELATVKKTKTKKWQDSAQLQTHSVREMSVQVGYRNETSKPPRAFDDARAAAKGSERCDDAN